MTATCSTFRYPLLRAKHEQRICSLHRSRLRRWGIRACMTKTRFLYGFTSSRTLMPRRVHAGIQAVEIRDLVTSRTNKIRGCGDDVRERWYESNANLSSEQQSWSRGQEHRSGQSMHLDDAKQRRGYYLQLILRAIVRPREPAKYICTAHIQLFDVCGEKRVVIPDFSRFRGHPAGIREEPGRRRLLPQDLNGTPRDMFIAVSAAFVVGLFDLCPCMILHTPCLPLIRRPFPPSTLDAASIFAAGVCSVQFAGGVPSRLSSIHVRSGGVGSVASTMHHGIIIVIIGGAFFFFSPPR